MNTDVMFSKVADLWGTPRDFFKRLHDEHQFTIDAAADEYNHQVDRWFGPGGIAEDALTVSWAGEKVWLNPPYSLAANFVEKAYRESKEHGVESVILLPSRTDTRWFHDFCWADLYCKPPSWVRKIHFVKGRLRFTLHVTDEMREVVSIMAGSSEEEIQDATGLPKLILRAIQDGAPEVAESAPFPSLVVVMRGSE